MLSGTWSESANRTLTCSRDSGAIHRNVVGAALYAAVGFKGTGDREDEDIVVAPRSRRPHVISYLGAVPIVEPGAFGIR